MTAKKYLRRLKTLDMRIDAKLLEKERIRALGEKVTMELAEKVQVQGAHDRIGAIATRLAELEKEIVLDIDSLVDLKKEASSLIGKMEDERSRVILSMYYVSNKTFEEVAARMDVSPRWVYSMHGRALKEFEKILRTVQ